MTPILFPYTYVSETLAELLGMFFDKIVAYQPIHNEWPPEMQRLHQQGFLEVRTPGEEDDRDIRAVIKGYQNWARLHEGSLGLQASLLKSGDPGKTPFFDDSAPARILADLKAGSQAQVGQYREDPLFRARLLLHFAQEFDRNSQEIESDFDRQEERIHNLFKTLKAEDDLRADEFQKADGKQERDTDDLMLPRRLSAWTRLLLQDTDNSGIFVTPSPAVFEYVKDLSDDGEVIFHSEGLSEIMDPKPQDPNKGQSFMAHLSGLAENCSPAALEGISDFWANTLVSQAATVSILRVAGSSPGDFFAGIGKIASEPLETARSTSGMKNILIILIFSRKKR